MASEKQAYPQPVADEVNRKYLESWRNGRLALQYCTACEAFVFFPRPHCPDCWSSGLEWRDATGRGRITSFSLVYRPNHEAFFEEVPIVLAEIMLEEGVAMLARVVSEDLRSVQSGGRVELLPPDRGSRFPLPTFRLLHSEDGEA